MNLLMMILNYGGHVKPLYTRCASAKGGLVRLQGAPPGCLCHTLTSSLWLVAYFGLDPLIKTLLARGAKINASSDLCGTALHAAIQYQHTCQLLIDHGAMCKPVLRMEEALCQKRLIKD
jgi:hypothetical protein